MGEAGVWLIVHLTSTLSPSGEGGYACWFPLPGERVSVGKLGVAGVSIRAHPGIAPEVDKHTSAGPVNPHRRCGVWGSARMHAPRAYRTGLTPPSTAVCMPSLCIATAPSSLVASLPTSMGWSAVMSLGSTLTARWRTIASSPGPAERRWKSRRNISARGQRPYPCPGRPREAPGCWSIWNVGGGTAALDWSTQRRQTRATSTHHRRRWHSGHMGAHG